MRLLWPARHLQGDFRESLLIGTASQSLRLLIANTAIFRAIRLSSTVLALDYEEHCFGGRTTVMHRSDRIGERGGSKISLLLTLLVVGAMGFTAVKIVPVYVEAYQFQDSIEAESRFALTGYPKRSQDDIRDDIFKKAQELGIPAKRDDIRLNITNGSVEIGLDYSVPVDLKIYQFTLQFHPHADNHTI
jgi:hypothetical protein